MVKYSWVRYPFNIDVDIDIDLSEFSSDIGGLQEELNKIESETHQVTMSILDETGEKSLL